MCLTKGCVAILLACCVPLVAAAASWKEVGGDATTTVYIDMDSVVRRGDVVEVWNKFEYAEDQGSGDERYRSSRILVWFDCKQREWTARHITAYAGADLRGESVGEQIFPEEGLEWTAVREEGLPQTLLTLLCEPPGTVSETPGERLAIRAVPPDATTRFMLGEYWSLYLDGEIDSGAAVKRRCSRAGRGC